MSTALITGATGFLGSHFILNFYGTRISDMILIVRGATDEERRARFKTALETANRSYLQPQNVELMAAEATILNGDMREPYLGLTHEDFQMVKSRAVAEIWHFAASLNYEERRRIDIEATNVEGTRNILEFAELSEAKRLYHCSTAYTCGTQAGIIQPVWHDPNREFSNAYEESKCRAEDYLFQRAPSSNVQIKILRPSVVIGNSQTKQTGGSSSGLYGALNELHKIGGLLKNATDEVRLWVEREASVNLIPVDQLMQQMDELLTEGDTAKISVAHLVSKCGPSNIEIFEAIRDACNAPKLAISGRPSTELTGLEKLIDRRADFYGSYFRADRTFQPSVDAPASVTIADVTHYIKEGIRTIEGRDANSIFDKFLVSTTDDLQINGYTTAQNESEVETVLICNAVGMPVDVVCNLAKELNKRHRVITWESRGLPSPAADPAQMDASYQRQLEDAIEVLEHFNVDQVTIVGWCSGARIALDLSNNWPGRCNGLVLLNGGYNLSIDATTPFEQNIRNSMPRIAQNRRLAEVFFNEIFSRSFGTSKNDSAVAMNSLLYSAAADDVYLVSLPFLSAENLFTYARLISGCLERPLELVEMQRDMPVLVMTGDNDDTAGTEASELVARNIPGAVFESAVGGDHYSVHWDHEYIRRIVNFCVQINQEMAH